MALALSLSESQDAQIEVGLESTGAGWKGFTPSRCVSSIAFQV